MKLHYFVKFAPINGCSIVPQLNKLANKRAFQPVKTFAFNARQTFTLTAAVKIQTLFPDASVVCL